MIKMKFLRFLCSQPTFKIQKKLFSNPINCASVHEGILDNQKCIIKKQRKKYFRNEELQVLQKVKNDNDFCQLLDYYISDEEIFLFLEKYDTDLHEYLHDPSVSYLYKGEVQPNLDILEVINYIKTISYSLIKLKKKGYYHVDIKPTNIFMKDNKVVLGDFDLSTKINNYHEPFTFGTNQFIAPEIDISHKLHENSDVYSLGVTFIALLTKTLPPPEKNKSYISPIKLLNHLKSYRGDIPKYYYDLIENMLVFNPKHRYNIESIYKLLK